MSASIFLRAKAAKKSEVFSSKEGRMFLVCNVYTGYKKANTWENNYYRVLYFGDDCNMIQINKGDTVFAFGEEQHVKYVDRSGREAISVNIIAKDLKVIPSGVEEKIELSKSKPDILNDYQIEEDVPF